MTAALRAFLAGLIDYAGLFPPASLDMRAAIDTYARHLTSDHAWMLGRFVCPITRLDQLASKGKQVLEPLAPVRVAGLASPMNHAGTMMRVAADDAEKVKAFERGGWGVVDVLEARLPDDLVNGDPSEISLALDRYEAELRVGRMHLERIFYEVNRTHAWSDWAERCITACAAAGHRGFKIRFGGATPDAYPTINEVAGAIALCDHLRVPFKATAGLHHPMRHKRHDSEITEHGFVNVFSAGLLAPKLEIDGLVSILDDRDLGNFSFTDEHLGWSGHELSVAAIEKRRGTIAISYGSCDVDEPVADLMQAGLL